MTVAKLVAFLGFEVEDEKVKNFAENIKNVGKGMLLVAGVALGAAVAIKKLTDECFDAAAAMKQFEAETGASSIELQKWQSIAKKTNNSAQAVTASIKAITANQAKIQLGQGNISGYQLLGIDPTQDPFQILNELRVKTQGLSQSMKKEVLSQVGVSQDLIQVLDLTNDQFDSMYNNAFVVPQESIDLMDKAKASTADIAEILNFLKMTIAAELAPGIIKLNKIIVKWVQNNKKGIISTIKDIFKWLNKFVDAVLNVATMIDRLVSATIGWDNVLKGLLIVLGILNANLLISPIGLIIAGVLLLIAVLDDLYVYSTGKGGSLFGKLMEKFPEIQESIESFFGTIGDLKDLMSALFKGDETGVEEMVKKLGGLGKTFVFVFELLKATFNFFVLTGKLMISPFISLIDTIGVMFEALKGDITMGEAFESIREKMNARDEADTNSMLDFGRGISEQVKHVQNVMNIKVDVATGSGDPTEIANEIDRNLKSNINDASMQIRRDE